MAAFQPHQCHDCRGLTQITTFFLSKAYEALSQHSCGANIHGVEAQDYLDVKIALFRRSQDGEYLERQALVEHKSSSLPRPRLQVSTHDKACQTESENHHFTESFISDLKASKSRWNDNSLRRSMAFTSGGSSTLKDPRCEIFPPRKDLDEGTRLRRLLNHRSLALELADWKCRCNANSSKPSGKAKKRSIHQFIGDRGFQDSRRAYNAVRQGTRLLELEKYLNVPGSSVVLTFCSYTDFQDLAKSEIKYLADRMLSEPWINDIVETYSAWFLECQRLHTLQRSSSALAPRTTQVPNKRSCSSSAANHRNKRSRQDSDSYESMNYQYTMAEDMMKAESKRLEPALTAPLMMTQALIVGTCPRPIRKKLVTLSQSTLHR